VQSAGVRRGSRSLIVAISDDRSVAGLKGEAADLPASERAELVAALRGMYAFALWNSDLGQLFPIVAGEVTSTAPADAVEARSAAARGLYDLLARIATTTDDEPPVTDHDKDQAPR
jgi:hypothetical protein